MNAQANRLRGGGFEEPNVYKTCDITFCDIANIHSVTNVFNKMKDIPEEPAIFNSIQTYGPRVEQSGNLQLISTILKGVNMMMKSILEKGQNILVHCSDGWDRTA